ncbi:hypothetical protein BC659_0797 [Sediminibacterium goheungense]|uniref:Uncharacterized protein n=1 Tax=Sediminibacterium goheungense TaxID=1086393 RepID=A0A4R6J1J8_9BACT|nr:hypothetical protein BC659_0797 [Sediminibacterium goheungense]
MLPAKMHPHYMRFLQREWKKGIFIPNDLFYK